MKYRYKRGGCYDYSARRQVKQWFNDWYETVCKRISHAEFIREYMRQP